MAKTPKRVGGGKSKGAAAADKPKTDPTMTFTPIPGGLVRAEVHCAKCDPCVLVLQVESHPMDPAIPGRDALRKAIENAGWSVNKAEQAICPDCR